MSQNPNPKFDEHLREAFKQVGEEMTKALRSVSMRLEPLRDAAKPVDGEESEHARISRLTTRVRLMSDQENTIRAIVAAASGDRRRALTGQTTVEAVRGLQHAFRAAEQELADLRKVNEALHDKLNEVKGAAEELADLRRADVSHQAVLQAKDLEIRRLKRILQSVSDAARW